MLFFSYKLGECMSRKSWKMSRQRHRQRNRERHFQFGEKSVKVFGKGHKIRLAKAAVRMHLTPEEAERFVSGRLSW
jgi:hypothetical protein